MCGSLDRKAISDLNAPHFLPPLFSISNLYRLLVICANRKNIFLQLNINVCSFQCIDEEKDFILTRLA